jgi:hypothetical protein
MNSNPKHAPADHQERDEQSSQFKAFVEGTEPLRHPDREDQHATGTRGAIDQQNKMIDQHNLRK